MPPRISFTTGCKNRLTHLQQTLPRNLEDNPNAEFILVDYNCQQGTGQWVKDKLMNYIYLKRLVYLFVPKAGEYSHSIVKNIGARHASGDVICHIDGDNFAGPCTSYLEKVFEENPNSLVFQDKNRSASGRIAISRNNFYKIHGYDEKMTGWGAEDIDFRQRALGISGMRIVEMPEVFINVIDHSDEFRGVNIHENRQYNNVIARSRASIVQPQWGTTSVIKLQRTGVPFF